DELRGMFEQRVADETAQANAIFDSYQAEHGEQMSSDQMREATSDLPFYSQSVRGLDPRQTSLPLAGTGNDASPRPVAGPEPRTFDPLAGDTAKPAAVPVAQAAAGLGDGSTGTGNTPTGT